MVYGVDGDLAIVGTSVAAVTAVQRPTSPLSASADFQAATERDARRRSPRSSGSTSSRRIGARQRLGALDGRRRRRRSPNLRPLKSIAAWTTGGDTPTFEMFAPLAK